MTRHESNAQMVYVSCNLCGSDDSEVLFQESAAQPERRFGIVKCRGCGLVYRNVRVGNVRQVERMWREGPDGLSPDWIAARNSVFLPYLELVDGFRQNGRILDIGAGYGFFLETCRKRGWKECHGVIVRSPNAVFHVPMRKMFRGLRRLGLYGKSHDPTVIHLFSFSPRTLRRLLERCEFADIRMRSPALAWTTARDAQIGSGRKTASLVVEQVSRLIWSLSFGQLIISPSFLAPAQKPILLRENGR